MFNVGKRKKNKTKLKHRSLNEQKGYSGSSCKLASCADILYWPENCLKVGTAEFSYGYFVLCVIMVASMVEGESLHIKVRFFLLPNQDESFLKLLTYSSFNKNWILLF